MTDCRLADLNVRFVETYDRLKKTVVGFGASFDCPDITVQVTPDDLVSERIIDNGAHPKFSDADYEPFAAFRCLGNRLPALDGLVMHGCLIQAGEKGILFTARSGTGKTTHMMLWKKLLGNRMNIVNGDKPIVRFPDDTAKIPFGYGTPWAGKENLRTNTRVGLTDVCMIERAAVNKTVPLSRDEGVELLMRQTYLPPDLDSQQKTAELINRIADGVRFWKICCNMELDAAQTAFSALFDGASPDDLATVQNIAVPSVSENGTVLSGTFVPSADTTEFVLSDLPFPPQKVSVFCGDLLNLPDNSETGYFISVNFDLLGKGIGVSGMGLFADGAQCFLMRRRNDTYKASFDCTHNSFSIKNLMFDNKHLYFVAGKTYTFFILGV